MISWRVDVRRNRAHRSSFWERRRPGRRRPRPQRQQRSRGGRSDSPPSHDPTGTGEVMDADARAVDGGESAEAPVDVTAEEQAWDEAMHQALNIARAEGKVPGQVVETIQTAHASTLDWRTLLSRYMTDAASHDYSWSVPNPRRTGDRCQVRRVLRLRPLGRVRLSGNPRLTRLGLFTGGNRHGRKQERFQCMTLS